MNITELIRVLEVDYEKTTKSVSEITSTSFTIRGWGITLISALIGFTFQTQHWQVAALAVVVTLLIAFVDCYHSWLYAMVLQHANKIETILRYYYGYLARGDADPQAKRDFLVRLLSHRFGRFSEINQGFSIANIKDARPRPVLITLYATLLACAVVSGVLVVTSAKKPATLLDCTPISANTNVYVCQPK